MDQRQLAQFIEELTCPVCLTNYKEVMLDCGHSLCSQCRDLLFSKEKTETITCPVCRKPSHISATKVDYTLKGAVAMLRDTGVVLSASKPSQPPPTANSSSEKCCACDSEIATIWCAACGDLCDKCSSQAHLVLKTHKPVPISEKVTQPALCPLHGEKLKYYCILCAKLICADCERDPSACKGHEALLLSEAATKKRADITSQINRIQAKAENLNYLLTLLASRQEQFVKASHDVDSLIDGTEKRFVGTLIKDNQLSIRHILMEKFAAMRKCAKDIYLPQLSKIEDSLSSLTELKSQYDTAVKLGTSVATDSRDIFVIENSTILDKVSKLSCDISGIAKSASVDPSLKISLSTIESAVSSLPYPTFEPVAIPGLLYSRIGSDCDEKLEIDPGSVLGPASDVQVINPTTVQKKLRGNCAISCKNGFKLSPSLTRVKWKVRYLDASIDPTQGWLLVAVHRDPLHATCDSFNNVGCFGVAVTLPCNKGSTWTAGAAQVKKHLKVNCGDVLDCLLDLSGGTFSVSLFNQWNETVPLDQKMALWFPHFNAHGASFSLLS